MAGSADLRLPEHLREAVYDHIRVLREGLGKRQWGGRVGFGERPAVIAIDLARGWTDPGFLLGAELDSIVGHTRRVLDVAREAGIPIFFTVVAYDPDDPPGVWDAKKPGNRRTLVAGSPATELDTRLARRPSEKLIVKKYQSAFAGTDLHEMLVGLRVDTLIVTGCSTSHCVHATCLDASRSFRVIVPEEAVGERCELFHLMSLLDIDMTLGDVLPVDAVLAHLKRAASS